MSWRLISAGLLLILPGCLTELPRLDITKLTEARCPEPSECHQYNRHHCRDPIQGLCGTCRAGYIENEEGQCIPLHAARSKYKHFRSSNGNPEDKIDAIATNKQHNLLVPHLSVDGIDKAVLAPGNDNTINKIPVTETTSAATPDSSSPNQKSLTPQPQQERHPHEKVAMVPLSDVYFVAIVAGCSVAGLIGLIVAGVCWYRLQKNVKAASEVEYPAYGVTGPTKERPQSPGDRKLAQSAQMYHYQHQKQQMIALEKANGEMKHDASDEDSDEENEEGDYTVYECPGLAPTGEMEVKNPLFSDDTPVSADADGKTEQ